MDVIDFFNHDCVQFPLKRVKREDEDFEHFVEDRLDAHVNLIKSMSPSDGITTRIRTEVDKIGKLCDHLKKAIKEYLSGLPHKAFAQLDEAIHTVDGEFRAHVSLVDHQFQQELYRIRVNEERGARFTKGDLFHIPFGERHKVRRQRYSIPGLPCLYLGGSLYICWEELGRPPFESIQMARFRVAEGQSISVLDFMQRSKHIVVGIENAYREGRCPDEHKFFSHAACWPLMAMVSIKRKHGDAPFIAEYIVPQLILQWITENIGVVDGIAYSSVSCDTHATYPAAIANFVFPSKEIGFSGHCSRLRSKFALTDPVGWHLLEGVDSGSKTPFAAELELELIPGQSTRYAATAFGKLEAKLLSLPVTTF